MLKSNSVATKIVFETAENGCEAYMDQNKSQ
jgi:hypothetical protein